MKKVISLIAASVCFLSACSSDSTQVGDVDVESVPVRFHLELQPDIIPFYTRVIPEGLPSEPVAEENESSDPDSGETSTSSSFSFMEYVVFDENEQIVRNERLKHDDDDSSMEITDEFTPGVYQICFFAHSSEDAELSDGKITFPTDVSECFYYLGDFEVEVGNDIEKSYTLERRIARVEFVPKDELPDYIASFRITTSGIYKTFDLLTGYATDKTNEFTLTETFTADDRRDDAKLAHAFYTFVPETQESDGKAIISEACLQALSSGGNPEREKVVSDIPIYINRITRYTGTLYTNINDGTFNLNIDDRWGETLEEDLDASQD